MNWTKFAIWLTGIYIVYYLALIIWDMLRNGRSPKGNEPHQLTFAEHIKPEQKQWQEAAEIPATSILSSGGVSLKQLYSLAREEAIEYTKAVSF